MTLSAFLAPLSRPLTWVDVIVSAVPLGLATLAWTTQSASGWQLLVLAVTGMIFATVAHLLEPMPLDEDTLTEGSLGGADVRTAETKKATPLGGLGIASNRNCPQFCA